MNDTGKGINGGQDKNVKLPPSEARAIRLMGTALEEIERQMLWKMGGQIGGFNPATEIGTSGNGCLYEPVNFFV
jgi:hypothetical protein